MKNAASESAAKARVAIHRLASVAVSDEVAIADISVTRPSLSPALARGDYNCVSVTDTVVRSIRPLAAELIRSTAQGIRHAIGLRVSHSASRSAGRSEFSALGL